jgi:hypothetical protein
MTQTKARAGSRRRPRSAALAVRPEQSGQSGRADDDRQAEPLAEQRDRQIARRRPTQRLRQELHLIECRLIPPERQLILSTTIGEIEHRPRQRAAR